MHDSERRTNHSLEISSSAFARSLLSASHILILPHSETCREKITKSSTPFPNDALNKSIFELEKMFYNQPNQDRDRSSGGN